MAPARNWRQFSRHGQRGPTCPATGMGPLAGGAAGKRSGLRLPLWMPAHCWLKMLYEHQGRLDGGRGLAGGRVKQGPPARHLVARRRRPGQGPTALAGFPRGPRKDPLILSPTGRRSNSCRVLHLAGGLGHRQGLEKKTTRGTRSDLSQEDVWGSRRARGAGAGPVPFRA